MNGTSITSLPAPVRMALIDDALVDSNNRIQKDFTLSDDQLSYALDGVLDIVLHKRQLLDLPNYLAKMPYSNRIDLRALGLRLAQEQLWPLQEYLGSVDILISRLGGRIPPPQPLPKVDEEDELPPQETWTAGSAKEILQRYKNYSELYMTQKPIRDTDGRLKAPSVGNWLSDYLHTMGAEGASTLKRSQYISRSSNAQNLNDDEKRNLLNFLVSYESGIIMYWHIAEEHFLLIEPEPPKAALGGGAQAPTTEQMSDLLSYFTTIQSNHERLFEQKKEGLKLEIGDNPRKLADIAWDALGMQDADRCLSAFDLLIEHHALADVLRTDQRYRGIVARYIGVRYGTEAKTFWNGDLSNAVMLALLWKIMLIDKLALDERRAAIVSHMLSKKMGVRASPMYLDLKSGKFLFREIAYKDRSFSFI